MENNHRLDLTLIPKELSLLLEIIKMEEGLLRLNDPELFKEINWERFLHLAWHHRVFPEIYYKLKNIDDKRIPPQVTQNLYQKYKLNTFQMLNLSSEMEQISELFTNNKIPLLYLKGPVIAYDLYGDISLRTSRDLDILIQIKDLERVDKLLVNLGYEREGQESILNVWKWKGHHITYIHAQKNICLEIHWRLQRQPSKEPSFFEMWDRKRKSRLTTYPVYYLGQEDLFLFLVSHGARHGWVRLRWLLDIDKYLRKGVNWESVNLLQKQYQNHHLVGQAIILASQLLETPIKEEMKVVTNGTRSINLAQKAINFIRGTDSSDVIMTTKEYKLYLFSLKSNLQKVFFVLLLFYPGNADVKTLRLPNSLHFLYFPLRPLLKIWRIARKYFIKNT
ncbi:nucleotidyltransferase domain-containing protein [Peribacillus simplex]